MDNDNDTIIYCSRCGAEMKSSSRYCMKCGNLNYDHEANKDLKRIQPKEERRVYQVGSGETINVSSDNGGNNLSIAQNTYNDKNCFLVNFGLYLIIVLLCGYFSFGGVYTVDSLLTSSFPLLLIIISSLFLYFYAIQLVYVKSDKKWWYAFIPIYNIMVLSDITFHNKYLGLLVLIPGLGIIFLLVIFYQLGKKFNYNGLLTALLPFIMVLFIGFGVHPYEGKIFVNYNEKHSLEKKYKYRKVSFVTGILFIAVGISMFIFSDFENFQNKLVFFGRGYYVYTARSLVNSTKRNIAKGNFSCDGEYSEKTGVYYFYYGDARDGAFLLFYDMHEPISAVVVVNQVDSEANYSVSLSDGTLGFPLKDVNDISMESVQDYSQVEKDNLGTISCQITS